MAQLVIFGAGDIARLAHFFFTRDSEHEVVAFAVDSDYRENDSFLDLPLIDAAEVPNRYPPTHYQMFVALSYARMNQVRADKYYWAKDLGYTLPSYISSHCTWLTDHPAGDNCFILEDNTIQPFVQIGSNVTLWSGNHIGHDAIIEDHCFITSHVVVSGHVRVGTYSFLGVNATLRHAMTIAPHTLVGAGAVLMKDTEEAGVYVPPRVTQVPKKSHEANL
jgi:sugar O-acyltransferase (sialic acid O-acetyltransferase NeuD family)